MFCYFHQDPLTPIHQYFWLLFTINNYKSNRVRGKKVKSTILCHLKKVGGIEMCCLRLSNLPRCTAQVWLKRITKWSLMLYYCCTHTPESRSSPVNHKVGTAQIFQPRTRPWCPSISQTVDRSDALLYISQPESDLKALQGSREALKSRPITRCGRTGLDFIPCGGFGFRRDSSDPPRWTINGSSLHECVSACVFTLSNVHGAHESTLEMVSKRLKK